ADDQAAAVHRRDVQAPGEARPEVACDAESREDAAEGRRLEQHEDELERRVAGRIVEAREVLDLLKAAGEGGKEEQREELRRQEDRRVLEQAVERPPRDCERDRSDRRVRHVRVSLPFKAQAASASETTARPTAMENASASASPSQPVMIRLRIPSIRYETGFAVATSRNQVTRIRLRGAFIDETKSAVKMTGNSDWIDSP